MALSAAFRPFYRSLRVNASTLLFFVISLLFFAVTAPVVAQEDPSLQAYTHIPLKGYLSAELLKKASKKVEGAKENEILLLEINSNGADLSEIIELAKKIYIAKGERSVTVIAYIDDEALGPVALLPFVADQLYISLFVSWGDIQLGSEGSVPSNILRNQVLSLIAADHPQVEIWRAIASAMSDKGADLSASLQDFGLKGQPLVLNQQQLQQLNLVRGVLSPLNFRQQWKVGDSATIPLESLSGDRSSQKDHFGEKFIKHIRYSTTEPNLIGRIIIEDHSKSISQATWLYVKNALDYYKKKKPIFIILELNTPGGEVFAAQKISDALKEIDTQHNIPVVCFINNWAISAGAMLAYSCRFITTVKDGSMGAAEPVIIGEGSEMKTASEKVNSALRTDFANRARFFDRNAAIAEAMVDKDIILVERHGTIIKLDSESQLRTTPPNSDVLISAKGKLLTLNAQQMVEYQVADLMVQPEKLTPITAEEQELSRWPAEKMLLFQAPHFNEIPRATIDSFQMDWKMRFFALLATPLVSSLLLLGVMLGFYVEVTTPGFGVPGAIALLSLLFLLLSSYALEIANWLEIVLLFSGLAIMLIDLLILPSFGLLGLAGGVLFIVGLMGILLPNIGSVDYEFDSRSFNAAGEFLIERLSWFSGTFLIGTAIVVVIGRYYTPTFAAYSKLVLAGEEQDVTKGYLAVDSPDLLPPKGAQGEVIATLRPTGKVTIGDVIYDAIAAGGFIEKGRRIEVKRIESNLLVVSEVNGK